MSLKEIIRDQTIIIDDHKRGNKEVKKWDDVANDVHIDKSTNYLLNGKRQKIRIRIPINSKRPIKIENARKKEIDIPSSLSKEIRNAFENEKIRKEFITEVVDVLKNFESILSNEELAHQVLSNLSKHFNLNWTGEKITSIVDNILKAYTEVYQDESGVEYFFKLNEQQIEIGQNSGYAKQFKKLNRN